MTHGPQNLAVRSTRIIAVILVIAALFFARSILIPTALAILLTLLLDPLVKMLERIGFRRGLAVGLILVVVTGAVGSIGLLVGRQMIDLSIRLPDYQENLRGKIRDLRASGESAMGRLTGTLRVLNAELSSSRPASVQPDALAPNGTPEAPVKVQLVPAGPDFSQIATGLVGPIMVPIGGTAVMLVLLSFLLLQSDDVRARLASHAGLRRISLTTHAMNEITQRIGRYLRMLLVVNSSYGMMVGAGLFLLGIPNALSWGALGFALRFIPYVGPWMAAILPVLLAAAAFPGWGLALAVAAFFVVIELITNLVLEPWLFGTSAGISTLGVVCASMFWGWLWGPIGLIMAVPLTACLLVVARHVPQWVLLHQLFAVDADVSTVGQLYQQLLAGDATSADQVLTSSMKAAPLEAVCDEVLLPMLSELKRDLSLGSVDIAHARRVMRMLEMLIGDDLPKTVSGPPRLVCVGGQNEVDACAAVLLMMACQSHGVPTGVIPSQVLAGEVVEYVAGSRAAQVAVVQVAPISVPHSRRLIKALSATFAATLEVIDLAVGDSQATVPEDSSSPVKHEHSFVRVVAPLAEKESVVSVPPPASVAPEAA